MSQDTTFNHQEWHVQTYGRTRFLKPHQRHLKPRRPTFLWLHRDWWLNYRPKDASQLAHWHVLHWQGAPKPWAPRAPLGSSPFLTGLERASPAVDALWLAACTQMNRDSHCMQNGTRACLAT